MKRKRFKLRVKYEVFDCVWAGNTQIAEPRPKSQYIIHREIEPTKTEITLDKKDVDCLNAKYPKFKVGDRIELFKGLGVPRKGTVKGIKPSKEYPGTFLYAIEYDEEFTNKEYVNYECDCNGLCKPHRSEWKYEDKLKYCDDDYKWHDLRKNPDDLPKEDGLYFCCSQMRGGDYFPLAASYENNKWNTCWADCIIAWSDYPPFLP